RPVRFAQAEILAVLDHADDLDPRAVEAVEAEASAERRLPRPEAARERLVDERNTPARFRIGLREIAPLQQLLAEPGQHALTPFPGHYGRRVATFLFRLALDLNRLVADVQAQRHEIRQPGSLHARQRSHSFE